MVGASNEGTSIILLDCDRWLCLLGDDDDEEEDGADDEEEEF